MLPKGDGNSPLYTHCRNKASLIKEGLDWVFFIRPDVSPRGVVPYEQTPYNSKRYHIPNGYRQARTREILQCRISGYYRKVLYDLFDRRHHLITIPMMWLEMDLFTRAVRFLTGIYCYLGIYLC